MPPSSPSTVTHGTASNCGLSITSLVCGLSAALLGPITGIIAIISGGIALIRIHRSRGVLQGRVRAVFGLTMGCVFSALYIVVFFPKPHRGYPQTQQTAVSFEQAVNAFHSEYERMPIEGTSDRTIDTSKDTELLEVLLGMNEGLNPRGLKFLTAREGRAGKNGRAGRDGLIYDAINNEIVGLFDPWGAGYRVRVDLDGDGEIRVNGEILKRRVAVWSPGPDGVDGTTDDVKSW